MKKQQRRNRLEEWINLSTYYLYFPIKLLRKTIIIILFALCYCLFPAKRERIKETTKELWSPYNEYANLYFSKSAIFPFIPHVSLIWSIWSLVYIYFDFAKKLSFLIVSLTIFFVVFFIFEWAIGDKSWEYIQKFRQMPVKEKVVKCIIVYGYAFASLALLRYVLLLFHRLNYL